MSDFGLSVLAFLKLAKVIDPNAASYHDINDMDMLVETFGVFFEGQDQEKLELGARVRSMVRWLCKQAPKEVVTPINTDKLFQCDPDQIEKVAILMFYCKKQQPEQFAELLNELDEHDRKILIGASETDTKEKISQIAASVRQFVEAFRHYSILNAHRDELLAEEKSRGSVDDVVEAQQEKMRQRIRRDQDTLAEMKAVNEQLKRSNDAPIQESATSLRDLQATLVRLNVEVDNVREQRDSLCGKLEQIDEMREQRSLGDMSKDELRKELLNLGRAKARQKELIEEKRKQFASKCQNLDDSVREFVKRKQELRDRVVSNILELKHDKQGGVTRDKITLIKTLRNKRDDLRQRLEESRSSVAHLQQKIESGKFPVYA